MERSSVSLCFFFPPVKSCCVLSYFVLLFLPRGGVVSGEECFIAVCLLRGRGLPSVQICNVTDKSRIVLALQTSGGKTTTTRRQQRQEENKTPKNPEKCVRGVSTRTLPKSKPGPPPP
jgi:hypothetical protein